MFKYIKLTQGKKAKVDAHLYDKIAEHRWYAGIQGGTNKYRAQRNVIIDGKHTLERMHIYIAKLIGIWKPGMVVDHIDGNPLNNTSANLQMLTTHSNIVKQGVRSNNTSGYRGVGFHKASGKWRADIAVTGFNIKNRIQISLGLYTTAKKAYRVYKTTALEWFGPNSLDVAEGCI